MTQMPNLSTTWVIIPAYNEAAGDTIVRTVKSVREVFPNVVVVDDCSSDGTGDIALGAGAHVCRHLVNLGQGAALATGISYALSSGATDLVTFDADGQHQVADALALVRARHAADKDVALGSRFLGKAIGASPVRLFVLRCAVLFTKMTTQLHVTDTHNGLRVFSAEAARKISIRQNRMAHASEILHQISKLQLSYLEVPITIEYTEYSRRKGQKLSGALSIVLDLFLSKISR